MKNWIERIDNVEKLKKRWRFDKISYFFVVTFLIIIGIIFFVTNLSNLGYYFLIGGLLLPIMYPFEKKAYEKRLKELQENQNNNNKFS